MTKVSRITIGRLYNLGNYEHIRYEIAVDVENGDDAGKTMRNLEKILAALDPKPQALDDYSLSSLSELEKLAKESTLTPYQKDQLENLREKYALRRAGIARRNSARAALNNLGGTAVFTDAKQEWEIEDL